LCPDRLVALGGELPAPDGGIALAHATFKERPHAALDLSALFPPPAASIAG
jgi:hypothetical protein